MNRFTREFIVYINNLEIISLREKRTMGKHKGFTLIELLVVIAIITVLLAILTPSLKKARNQARSVTCRSNLKQWGTILMLYTGDNEGWLPSDHNRGAWLLRGSKLNPGETAPISHSFTTKEVGLCPSAKKATPSDSMLGSKIDGVEIKVALGGNDSAWKIIDPVPEFTGSYGFNYFIFDSEHGGNGMNVYQANNSYKTPILLDCGMPYGSLDGNYNLNGTSISGSAFPQTENYRGISFCINRHDGFVNSLFLDWSVRKVGLKELWTLKWNEDFDTANKMTLDGGVKPGDWPEWMRRFKDY